MIDELGILGIVFGSGEVYEEEVLSFFIVSCSYSKLFCYGVYCRMNNYFLFLRLARVVLCFFEGNMDAIIAFNENFNYFTNQHQYR